MTPYDSLQRRLATGWNTWNTQSICSHVLLPEGLAVDLTVRDLDTRYHLREVQIGRKEANLEQVRPGPRTWDGGYTELDLTFRDIQLRVRTGVDDGEFIALVEPLNEPHRTPLLIVESGMLWGRPGSVCRQGDALQARLPNRTVDVHFAGQVNEYENVASGRPYVALRLGGPTGISTGRPRTVEQIREVLDGRRKDVTALHEPLGDLAEVGQILQTVLAWNTIYEPHGRRVVSPVSRMWNVTWGGYVLFCWDTYFAASMAALTNRDIAYANLIEITREADRIGFVPNYTAADNNVSLDRSQPPVGSLTALSLYERFGDRWVLEEVFAPLLTWNRWWRERRTANGLLCWGSHHYTPRREIDPRRATFNSLKGAMLESGLDNSPMYDDMPFDAATGHMGLADVGLMGLYAADCDALMRIAGILGRTTERDELALRAQETRQHLAALWNEERGIHCNLRLDTGRHSDRLSPTCFYPLLAGAATEEQARRAVEEHLLNPREFWGEWVLPAISRDDPAYGEQKYWRGRVWAPMNYLVYLGLRKYDLPEARAALAERSLGLLLKEWREHGHVHENYNANTGEGDDVHNSDSFYHWGGLLGLIALMERGLA